MTEPDDELRETAAASALDALDDAFCEKFAGALETSPELRAELDGFRAVAARLADTVPPVVPPATLRAGVMGRLDEVAQEPAAAETPGTDAPPARPADVVHRRHRRSRIAVALVAAAAVVVLVAGGVVVALNWAGPNGWGAQRELAAIEDASDSGSSTVEVAGGGEATLVWSAEQGRSAIRAEGLPDLGSDESYQLWYIDESGATSAGTFEAGGDEVWRILDGEFTEGVTVGITVEPAGGSPQPTSDPIAAITT